MFTTRNMDVLANKKHWGHNWPPAHTFKRGPINFQEKTQNESGGKKLQEISDYTPGSFSD